jgi:2-amino-4-hydroxy-6-hydroxymethyldihydropteridine diphosphokinase
VTDAVLSIGSNVGDRRANLQIAIDAVRPWLRTVSPVYETPPWGPVPQDDYLNAIVLVADPGADAARWLTRAQAAEQTAGRTRDVRWGPRTLDIDLVVVSDGAADVTSDDPHLTLPHPRAHERAFVLVPWLAAQPNARLAGTPVTELVQRLPVEETQELRRTGVELR